MASKIEWTPRDYAARDIIDRMLSKTDLSYRDIEEKLGGQVSYNRVRDIRLGRRAPVRLSEFIAICDLCGYSTLDAISALMIRAKEIEQGTDIGVDADDSQWIADHLDQFDIAAKHGDTEAEQQAYEDLP